jgi:superfamily I DNA/RNA helicase
MSRSLTENQQNFVNEILNGVDNLVLIARAGCGKTTTIEEALIQYTKKFPLKKAVAFCFNVNIKDELRARGLKAYNFHGFGLFIISTKFKSFNPKKDIDEDKGFRIAIEIMNLDASNMSDQDIKDARSIQKLCSLAKSFNCSYSDAWNTDETWKFIIDYYDIKTYKQVNLTDIGKQCLKKMSYWDGTVDYDDLVWLPVVRGWLFPFVDLALVDEAQDLNAIQFEFIRRIIKSDKVTKKKIGRMAFVLDPSQALYTWRAAMINAHEHIIKTNIKRNSISTRGGTICETCETRTKNNWITR